MKSVLLSIKPKYCELIVGGIKTIEIRKTKPKLDTPFKCYIYCTNTKPYFVYGHVYKRGVWEIGPTLLSGYSHKRAERIWEVLNGKVIGEFICEKITSFYPTINLDMEELFKYADGEALYAWHISDLKIYDKPKELSGFIPNCTGLQNGECVDFKNTSCPCQERDYNPDGTVNVCKCINHMKRPPQSWCYVEEVEE